MNLLQLISILYADYRYKFSIKEYYERNIKRC